ncbi:MAG: hypothetical protein ACJA1Z_002354 [Patiriisocius sp.]|jgi:hypothetical protein
MNIYEAATRNQIPVEIIVIEEPDCYAMNNNDFNKALEAIKNKTCSEAQPRVAKQIAQRIFGSYKQITIIKTRFSFDSNKLEFAKYAYLFCFNPYNYWKANDAFGFDSAIDELNLFLEGL